MPNPVTQSAQAVTQRSGTYSGKGVLTAELMLGFVLVAIRLVAHFEIQADGSVKGKVVPPQGQYGPIAVLVGLIGVFFFLSLLAMGGGTRAKLAVIFGGIVITALGVGSYGDILTIGNTFGAVGSITPPAATGVLPDIFEGGATAGPAVTPISTNASSPSSSAPPAAPGVGTNPNIFTKLPGTPGGPSLPNGNGTSSFSQAKSDFGAAGRAAEAFGKGLLNPEAYYDPSVVFSTASAEYGEIQQFGADSIAGVLDGINDARHSAWNNIKSFFG